MYRGRTFNRERVYVCGDYLDGDIYPVFQKPGERRKRCRPTSEIQKKLNQRNAAKRLTRIVHMNFTSHDLALHLTYDPAHTPESAEDALRIVQNYLRTLKRRYRKIGVEFKYILSTEKGGRGGRIHHHLIISGGLDRDTLESLWGRGYANSKRLQFGDEGVSGLTHYITKDDASYKRWSGSRNLVQPEAQPPRDDLTMEDVRTLFEAAEIHLANEWFESRFPGYELVNCEPCRNETNRGYYIHFEMRRKNST